MPTIGALGPRRAFSGVGPLVLLLGLLPGGCGDTPTEPTLDDRPATRAAFLSARARWTSQRISSYEYSYRRLCFCVNTEPVRITVRAGVVSVVASATTGAPLSLAGYPTVDDLFAQLQQALDQDAHEIQATYDPVLGYPLTFYIDLNARSIDEEQRIEAGDLMRLS